METHPICPDCGQTMIEVGGLGHSKEICELDDNRKIKVVGIQEIKLYQCPEDKTVAIS